MDKMCEKSDNMMIEPKFYMMLTTFALFVMLIALLMERDANNHLIKLNNAYRQEVRQLTNEVLELKSRNHEMSDSTTCYHRFNDVYGGM